MMKVFVIAVFSLNLLSCAGAQAQTGPWVGGTLRGRIALSHDGNFNDEDDWSAFPVVIALLDAYGVTDNLVHVDFNNIIQDNDPRFESEMTASVLGAAERYGIRPAVLHNCRTDLEGAVRSICDAVNASSADNPLYYLLAGPMDVPYRGILGADADKRRHVYCLSHSVWNDGFGKRRIQGRTKRDVIALGVHWIQVQPGDRLQYPGTPGSKSTPENWARFQWLRDSHDQRLEWIYTRLQTVGRCDVSDATITYAFLTGDEQCEPRNLAAVLDKHEKLKPLTVRPTIRLEAENFAVLENFAPVDGPRQISQRLFVRPSHPGKAMIRTTFDEIYAARSGKYEVAVRYRDQVNSGPTFALRVGGVPQGPSWKSPVGDGVWKTHTIKDVVLTLGDEIAVEVQSDSREGGDLDYVEVKYQGQLVESALSKGTVQFAVAGADGRSLPCRVHLADDRGKPRQAAGLPFFHDHFVCPGWAQLALPQGTYHYQIERGPEYDRVSGSFEMTESAGKKIDVRLKRIADLAAQGWFAGDLHVHRPIEDMEVLMRAEDLHVAPAITWWNNRNLWTGRALPREPLVRFDGNRYYHVMGGEDEREGGALMFFNLDRPLGIVGASREYPSPMKFVAEARKTGNGWIDVEKPFWWDVPVWLASGQVDSIGLANNHMCRSTMYATEAWGKPRDERRLPAPRGNGFWTQEIYYHILNCGLRVPPSAGSASGVLPNPLGYNRVYVHIGEHFGYEDWWKGLKAGCSFVTNGPLLVVQANGRLPGHVFSADEGQALTVSVDVSLTTLDAVSTIEIIKNGRVEFAAAPQPSANPQRLGPIRFTESGWFLVQVTADVKNTFRFASTAPYYVEIGQSRQRISKQSAQFFLDWVDERIKRVPLKLVNPEQLKEVLAYHQQARAFWQDKVHKANAE